MDYVIQTLLEINEKESEINIDDPISISGIFRSNPKFI